MKRFEIPYFGLLLLIVIFFGLYIRFDDVKFWEKNKKLFFYKGSPIYSEYDSYFFARVALDVKEGKFRPGKIDNYRFFPDNSSKAKINEKIKFFPRYSVSGSLLSIIWGYLSKWLNISLGKLTWYLVPVFAVIVAIPLFLYLKDLGYPYAGVIGGLIAVSAPMYFSRTYLMRLDHDMLNLAFPFFIAYAFFKFFETQENKKKYFWIIVSSFALILYQLWYGHSNLNFVLVLMFLIRYLWDRKLKWEKGDVVYILILLIPQLWYLYEGPVRLWEQIKILVFNIKSPTDADILFKDFPNIFMSISELQRLSFKEVLRNIIFNQYLGVIGLLGSFVFFIFNLRKTIFILPYFGIGLLSFFSGARFAMYLAPFIGIGIGYIFYFIFNKLLLYLALFKEKEKQKIMVHLLGTITFLLILWVQKPVLGLTSFPKVFSPLVKDMVYLKNHTPENSAIWTWWDYGYAFQLYSRRATFHDGGSQGTPKTYFIARSFTTSDPKEAWYITSFISNYGLTGIAKKLLEGISAKELVERVEKGEYAKEIKTPVYWVFTGDLFGKFAWIHYFGSYNFDIKKGTFGRIIVPNQCRFFSKNFLSCEGGRLSIDLNNGIITIPKGTLPIKYLYIKTLKQGFYRKFFNKGYIVEIVNEKKNRGMQIFITKDNVFKTLFNQMFILRNYDPKYFKLILDDFPYMVVYRVKESIK